MKRGDELSEWEMLKAEWLLKSTKGPPVDGFGEFPRGAAQDNDVRFPEVHELAKSQPDRQRPGWRGARKVVLDEGNISQKITEIRVLALVACVLWSLMGLVVGILLGVVGSWL